MDRTIKITVFTPTYNRSRLLKRVYESLLQQTNFSFEWIIVDDGSVDSTEELITDFIAEQKIPITYFKQENKGKHFAINKGVQLAKGELFLILDSDDELPVNSVKQILEHYDTVKNLHLIGGVSGRRNNADGSIVGNDIVKSIVSNSLKIRFSYKITGDLVEVFKTEVLKEFPFPEIKNEKFCPEALVWNRIAQKYNLLFFNSGIYTTEYLPDGLTAKIVKIRMTSPVASMICYSELASYEIPFIQKIKATLNYWRFSFNSSESFSMKMKRVNPIISLFCFPLGYIMYKNDKKKWL